MKVFMKILFCAFIFPVPNCLFFNLFLFELLQKFVSWQNDEILFYFFTYQRNVVHGENNYALVLCCTFCYSSQTSFSDMVAIQKLLFRRRLQPNFVL